MVRTIRTVASPEPHSRIWRNDPSVKSRARDRWNGRYGLRDGGIGRFGTRANDQRAPRPKWASRPVSAAFAGRGKISDVSLLNGKRILLVEDEPVLAIDAAAILDELGLNVIGPYPTLSQGIASAEAEILDLAMLDVNLRGEMSYPIADILSRRGVPLIFTTGYEGVDWRGAAPRIGKPYSQRDIETALLSVVS